MIPAQSTEEERIFRQPAVKLIESNQIYKTIWTELHKNIVQIYKDITTNSSIVFSTAVLCLSWAVTKSDTLTILFCWHEQVIPHPGNAEIVTSFGVCTEEIHGLYFKRTQMHVQFTVESWVLSLHD